MRVKAGKTLRCVRLFEESGLALSSPRLFRHTAPGGARSRVWTSFERRHYFWLRAPSNTPDAWDYTVSAGDMDKGMVLKHRFRACLNTRVSVGRLTGCWGGSRRSCACFTVDALTPSSVKLLGVRDDAQNYVNILFDKEVEAVTSVYAALAKRLHPLRDTFWRSGRDDTDSL